MCFTWMASGRGGGGGGYSHSHLGSDEWNGKILDGKGACKSINHMITNAQIHKNVLISQ